MLRLKYHKTTLFLTCQPTTPLPSLKADFVGAVRASNQPELSTLPQYTQPDGKSYPDWSAMDASQDIGLFVAGSTGDETIEGMTVFMPLDQDNAQKDLTVRKAGLKDMDVVCVGFRANGACKSDSVPFLKASALVITDTVAISYACFPTAHPVDFAAVPSQCKRWSISTTQTLFEAYMSTGHDTADSSLHLAADRPVHRYGGRGGGGGCRRPRFDPTSSFGLAALEYDHLIPL